MKTRLLIIIGIVIASIGLGAFAYYIQVQVQCESLPGYLHNPRLSNWQGCYEYLKIIENPPEPKLVDENMKQNILCAEKFDKIYEEFLDRPSCERSPPQPTCEPIGFDTVIKNNDEFNSSSCVYSFDEWAYLSKYNDIVWNSLSSQYVLSVPKVNPTDKPLPLIVEEWGYHMCGSFNIMIISHDEKRKIVWKYQKTGPSCVVLEPPNWQKFTHQLSTISNPIIISEHGDYYAVLYLGDMVEYDNLREHHDVEFDEISKVYFSVNKNLDV